LTPIIALILEKKPAAGFFVEGFVIQYQQMYYYDNNGNMTNTDKSVLLILPGFGWFKMDS
jgi:hypothetical protein